MTTDNSYLLRTWPPKTLGRLRVIVGRLGLDQRTYSHLPPREERRKLCEFIDELRRALDRQGMTIDQYLAAVDLRTRGLPRLPVSPIGQERRRLS